MFLLLFASVISDGQTATCTNWKFFNPLASTNPRGINRWGTVVGDAEGTNFSIPVGFIHHSNGTVKTYAVSNGIRTFFTRRNAQGVTKSSPADSGTQTCIPRRRQGFGLDLLEKAES
jgi:hypothetical protein